MRGVWGGGGECVFGYLWICQCVLFQYLLDNHVSYKKLLCTVFPKKPNTSRRNSEAIENAGLTSETWNSLYSKKRPLI